MSIRSVVTLLTAMIGLGSESHAQVGPPNDDCHTPLFLAGPGTYPFDTTLATTGTEGQAPTPACTTTGSVKKDLWFTYMTTGTGGIVVHTCNLTTSAEGNTKITLYNGAGCPSTTTGFACNDNACVATDGNSYIMTQATCGQVFTIQLGNSTSDATASIYGNFIVHQYGQPCFTASTPFCQSDVVGTTCLGCGNNGSGGHGCANSSFAAGGLLSTLGVASIGADTLRLTASSISGPGLFFQSDGLLGTAASFGDGMLCAGIGIIRLAIVFPSAGVANYPGDLASPPIHVAGGPINSGDIRHYQCWYRDAVLFCTPATFNVTQGQTITWTP